MRIGELCNEAGVSKELVRHYESLGLISSLPIQAGSRTYREFDEHALNGLVAKNGYEQINPGFG